MHRYAPLVLASALFMEQMDSTVISTSLPVIATAIGVGPITLKLALTAYLVALGVFIPLSGWMADRLGAKRIFSMAIIVFMAGSIGCALAGSLTGFVLARFIQGMGGAMMTPVGRVIVLKATDRSELVSAMALFTLPAVIGPLVGPPLGGFIATYFSWEWIFLINIPIGLVGIVLTKVYIPEVKSSLPPPLDVRGFFLAGLASSGIVFGLSVISLPVLPPVWGVIAVCVGLGAGLLLIRHVKRHPAPVLDLRLLGVPTFGACILAGSLFRIAMGAVPFLTPLMLQLGFGLSAFQSGMIIFTGAIGAILTKLCAKWIFSTFGFRQTLIVACGFSAIGTGVYALFEPESPYLFIILVLIASSFARVCFFTGINILGFADLDRSAINGAAAINGVFQQISTALGVALAGIVLEVSPLLTGSSLGLDDFHITFVMVAVIAALSVIPVLRLPHDVGADISGHRTG